MTIRYIAHQLHDLSVAGYFNGEKFTSRQLEQYIANMFRQDAGNQLIMEIALPDGRWLFTVNHFANGPSGYDYTIPDTRDQEARIKALLQ